MTWHPGEPELIVGRVMHDSGLDREQRRARVFNLYTPPIPATGDPARGRHLARSPAAHLPGRGRHIER